MRTHQKKVHAAPLGYLAYPMSGLSCSSRLYDDGDVPSSAMACSPLYEWPRLSDSIQKTAEPEFKPK